MNRIPRICRALAGLPRQAKALFASAATVPRRAGRPAAAARQEQAPAAAARAHP
jgi:hypothetical protein